MKITVRFVLTPLLFAIFYLLFTIPTYAQASPYTVPNTNPDVPKNLHTWTQNVMIEVMSAMSCQLSGIDPTDPNGKCLGVDAKTGKIGYVENGGGAIGVAGHMIGMLYTPPLHTGDYFKYLAGNFGIVKSAEAASGFEGLKPIQKVWVAFRNVVYLLFVIVFVVIGLAIMLRVKIDPRTVMTIQNQIPKIIIGLLLVTFSFAIAGFLIDLMYVVIFLSYEIISRAVSPDLLTDLNPLHLKDGTPFAAANNIRSGGLFGIAEATGDALFFLVYDLVGKALEGAFGDSFFGNLFGKLFGWVIGGAVAGVASTIAYLIVSIILIIVLIRLWFTLIMAYVGILLDVIFAPFWIVASLLPGVPIGFGAWLRSIIANLAAFPTVIIMFLLAKVFIDGFGATPSDTDFIPPLIGQLPGTDVIGVLIALGIIFTTPSVVAMIKAAIKAPSLPAGAIGAAIGAGTGIARLPGTLGQIGLSIHGLSYVPGAQRIASILGRNRPRPGNGPAAAHGLRDDGSTQ